MPLWCFQNLFIKDTRVLGVHCTLSHVFLVSTRKQNQYYFFLSESEEAQRSPGWSGLLHKIRTSFKGNIFKTVYLLHGIVLKSPVILTIKIWFSKEGYQSVQSLSHVPLCNPMDCKKDIKKYVKFLSTNLKQNCH